MTNPLFSLTVLATLLVGVAPSFAQTNDLQVRKIRIIETESLGVISPSSLVYSSNADAFFIGELRNPDVILGKHYGVQKISSLNDHVGEFHIWASISDPLNSAFNSKQNQLLFLNSEFSDELVIVKATHEGNLEENNVNRYDVKKLGLNNPQGLTFDSATGTLYILDAADQQIITLIPSANQNYEEATITNINLSALNLGNLRGIAHNSANGHLYVLNPLQHKLYELTMQGDVVSTRDLSSFELSHSQSMVFAPSGDQTDEASELSLYIADAGFSTEITDADKQTKEIIVNAGIVEFSLLPDDAFVSLAPIKTVKAQLVNTIKTSNFNPKSPDPSGITLLQNGNLLESDGEVNEMSIFKGYNLFELTLGGHLVDTSTTVEDAPAGFSDEPTGVSSVNPKNRHIFFTDDDDHTVFEINPGSDGRYGTRDDKVVSRIDTNDFSPSSDDPEGVAFGGGVIFVADGVNNEIYRITAGSNKKFGDSNDVVSHFDTKKHGLTDPEGIEFDSSTGHLFSIGRPRDRVFEFTTSGSLVRIIDISAANSSGLRSPAGLALAPGSKKSSDTNLYIVDRGIDNNKDRNENDGKIFEVSFGLTSTGGGNLAPVVNAGSNQTISLPNKISLNASVSDDGIPRSASVTWSQRSGPGKVTFTKSNAIDTTASFSKSGTYSLRLTASDSVLSDFDELTVVVKPQGSGSSAGVVESKVSASSDDAEENSKGRVSLSSSDLEMVQEKDKQTIGLRFKGISVPKGAVITNAYIQYEADETHSGNTSLIIKGEAANNAGTFTSNQRNISSRKKTGASVTWSPAAWSSKGEAGSPQRTSNIKSVIQEIVNRSGWSKNNSLVIIITGNGKRVAESFDGKSSAAPLLHIEFSNSGGGEGGGSVTNKAPNVNAGADQTIAQSTRAVLNATVSDDGLPKKSLTTKWQKVSGPGTVSFASSTSVDTTASFSVAGLYTLKLTVDDTSLSATDTVTIKVNSQGGGGGATNKIDVRVSTSKDDAEERVNTGKVKFSSSDLELGFDKDRPQMIGLRFNGLNIPKSAKITHAYIQYQVDEVNTGAASFVIKGEATNNASAFSSSTRNISSRNKTTASVNWKPSAWTTKNVAGSNQQTPNIASVIQEIINRSGWKPGNSLVITTTGSGKRVAESFDGKSAAAPLLHVEYK